MIAEPTVYIVESDVRARQSIEALVRTMHLTPHTFASAEAFLLQRDPDQHGCVVVDMSLPDMNGLQLAERLAAGHDRIPIIMSGARVPVRTVVRAMHVGAVTFLEKPYPADELCATIPKALELDRKRRGRERRRQYARQRMRQLTPQERQVMDYMLAGLPNKVIAKRLGVSLRTVEYRRHDIFEKTETDSLPELVRLVTDLEMLERTDGPPARRRNDHASLSYA
jgi:FixJ family two-component response regulator